MNQCPNCAKLERVIDTYPETHEAYCACGLVVDVSDGEKHVCFHSKNKFSDEQIAALNAKLKAASEGGERQKQ